MNTRQTVYSFSLTQCYNSRGSHVIDKIVIALLIFLILFTPVPFGSVGQTSIFVIEITAVSCFCLWLIKLFLLANSEEIVRFRRLYQDHKRPLQRTPFFHRKFRLARLLRFLTFGRWPRKNPAFGMVMEDRRPDLFSLPYHSLFGYPVKKTGLEVPALAFLALLLLQLIPLPNSLTAVISPASHDLYQSASKAAGVPVVLHPVSVDSFATLSTFLQYSAYFMIYLTAVNTIRTRTFYLAAVYVIVASALFQAVYGLYELFSGHQHILWFKKKYFLNCATGTFINRNHSAVYLGLSIPLLMALIAGRVTQLKASSGNILVRISRILDVKGGVILLQFFFIGLVLLGAAFSLSLSGITAIILSCASFFYLYSRIRKTRKVYWMVALAGIIAVGAWIESPLLQERLRGIPEEVFSQRSRFMVWKDTFHIFLRFPATGSGAGTFSEIFPVYRSFGTDTIYSQTHNEYLQLLSENGILMVFFFVAFFDLFLLHVRRIMAGLLSRLLFIQTGAFSSLLLLGFHNLVDFSFQIPAVAITGMILAALFFGSYRDEDRNNAAY